MPDRDKQSFVNFLTSGHSDEPSAERLSARMSKIKNDGLTQSGIECSVSL